MVGTVTTNGGLERFLQGQGLELVRTPVGDRHVAAAMRERACNLGGESSGHVLTPDWCPTGDGSRVGLQVLVRAARGARPLSDLLGAIPRFPRASAKVPDGGSRPPIEAVLGDPELVAMLAEVEGAGCRPLLRYSGTEPCLRIQVEGPAANLVEAWVQSLAEATARILARA